MSILRAKTLDLKQINPLTKKREENSILNEKEALEGKVQLESYPRRIVLEMTNACNIRCKMCGRNAADFKPTIFDKNWLDLFEPITDKIEEITLLGWGEPTLHPQFQEFLKWGEEHGLRKFFCTNGTRLNELKKDIFKYKVDLLTISLDGATKKTNNAIRIGSDFDTITNSIKEIVAEKKERGVNYPYLSIVMTMMQSNYHEMPQFVKLAYELGIQEVKGVYLTVFEDSMMEENLHDNTEKLKAVFEETERIGNELGIAVKLPYLQGEDIAGDKNHKDCFVGWRDFFLGSDGYVRSCMSTCKKLFKVEKYDNFDEMWNSVEYQEFRAKVNQENMDAPCKNCYQASFANWNKKASFVQIGKEFAPTWEE